MKVKKFLKIIWVHFFTLLFISCTVNTKSSLSRTALISGTIKGATPIDSIQMVEVFEFKSDNDFHIPYKERSLIAKTVVENGIFQFDSIDVVELRAVNLIFGDSLQKYAVAFLEPGKIELEIFSDEEILFEKKPGIEVRTNRKGTVNNEIFTNYRNQRIAIETSKKYSILKGYDKQAYAMYPDLDTIFSYEERYGNVLDERNEIVFHAKDSIIMAHNDKIVSPYMVVYEDYGFTDEYQKREILNFYENYDAILKGNSYYEMIKLLAETHKEKVSKAFDFKLKNTSGEEVLLSDFRGKYVLLDFWAYWCKPCIASFPHLKSVREKYKKLGFEIVGVSVDPNQKKWRSAIRENSLNWPQLVDDKEKTVAKMFEIVQYPTTVLIDPDGMIIGKDVDIDDKLQELLGF